MGAIWYYHAGLYNSIRLPTVKQISQNMNEIMFIEELLSPTDRLDMHQ